MCVCVCVGNPIVDELPSPPSILGEAGCRAGGGFFLLRNPLWRDTPPGGGGRFSFLTPPKNRPTEIKGTNKRNPEFGPAGFLTFPHKIPLSSSPPFLFHFHIPFLFPLRNVCLPVGEKGKRREVELRVALEKERGEKVGGGGGGIFLLLRRG